MNNNIKLLHLTNDYSGSTVYKNLCAALDNLAITQTVYNPIREVKGVNENKINFRNYNSNIIYSKILNKYTRLNFYHKKRKIYNDLVNKIDNLRDFNIVHAHTWYSDGAIAYELYKNFQIPYIVTVRSTDVNLFFKYMLHLRKNGVKILIHAKEIIFISSIYKEKLYEHKYFNKKRNILETKSSIIHNGIDDFWINNVDIKKNKINLTIQLLYIGTFLKRKNVARLIRAVEILNRKEPKITLNIIGGGRGNGKIKKLIDRSDFVVNHGRIQDKNELMTLIRNCDAFTMPSKAETFGLVYIEALSQGLPIIYAKGEGIDGLYKENIGEAVNANEVKSISDGILKIINNYSNYNFSPKEIVNNHNWNKIAQKYNAIYRSL